MTACRAFATAAIVFLSAMCADGAEDRLAESVVVAAPISQRPNIILIVTDDQRPDTIRSLGNAVIETPHLDGLAARGTAFTRAYAGYPICHVSRAQLLTGCCAFKALPHYPGGAIDSSLATLAGTLRAAGYHTCYTGKWHNDGHPTQRGYSTTSGLFSSGGAKDFTQPESDERGRPLTGYRGWTFKNTANDPELGKGIGLQPDNSRHVAEGAIQALRNAPVKMPFFVHVNFAFPHDLRHSLEADPLSSDRTRTTLRPPSRPARAIRSQPERGASTDPRRLETTARPMVPRAPRSREGFSMNLNTLTRSSQ